MNSANTYRLVGLRRQIAFILLLLGLGLQTNGQTGVLVGHIIDPETNEALPGASVFSHELGLGAYTDEKGHFRIEDIPVGLHDFRLAFFTTEDTILQGVRIGLDSTTGLNLVFPPPCKYNNTDGICPICHKKNKVVPIVYGLLVVKPGPKGYMSGGCIVTDCDPDWYGRRDKHKF